MDAIKSLRKTVSSNSGFGRQHSNGGDRGGLGYNPSGSLTSSVSFDRRSNGGRFTSSVSMTSADKFPSGVSSIDVQPSKAVIREHFLGNSLTTSRRRDQLDCFGVEDDESLLSLFSRASLRTPPEIREKILEEKRLKEEQAAATTRLQQRIKEARKNGKVDALTKVKDTLKTVGFGTAFVHTGRPIKLKKSVDMDSVGKKSTKVADESAKFYFSEEDRERKQKVKEEKLALLQARKAKAAQDRAMKMARAQAIKQSQRLALTTEIPDPIFAAVEHKYIGDGAKQDFLKLFHESSADLWKYAAEEDIPEERRTPHMLFIREQRKRNQTPLPLILRKAIQPRGVFLANKGLGDEKMLPVIAVLDKLPGVHAIDLSDNRLTDVSLMPLAEKLSKLEFLTQLNLSFNKIDDSSETIMAYLSSRGCKLKILTLNGADVDDNECGNLMEALSNNRSVESLSLSRNLIGKAETLNTVFPDLTTGGEAIAALLETTMSIKSLDVSWNFIRLASAEDFGRAMSVNCSLRVLNIAHNSFGDVGTQLLGAALKVNKTLKELDISYNSLVPRSSTVLANALGHNDTLTALNLNGNCIGKIGMMALVAAIQRSAGDNRVLKVSFENCDVKTIDPSCFNALNPNGTWTVDLSNPYGQMVMEECIFIANFRAGCNIVSLKYNGEYVSLERKKLAKERGKYPLEEFHAICTKTAGLVLQKNFAAAAELLKQMMFRQFGFTFDVASGVKILECLYHHWTGTGKDQTEELQDVFLFEVFHALFHINDTDFSGTLELAEFSETLTSLGKPNFDLDLLRRLMAEHDIDDSGTIDANEFAMIMVNHFCSSNIPRGDYVDSATGKPWVIPAEGIAVVEMTYECDLPEVTDVGGDDGIDSVICAIQDAKRDAQKMTLFEQAVNSPYFFLNAEHAQLLFDEVSLFCKRPLEIIEEILPQLVNAENCNHFLDDNLDEMGKLELRVRLGPMYNVFIGNPSGHYALDMAKSMDVKAGKKLAALSANESKAALASGINTSQRGKPSCFRNEMYNNRPVDISGMWFSGNLDSGILQVDYASTNRPRQGTKALSNARFQRLKQKLNLDELHEEMEKWSRLEAMAPDDDDEDISDSESENTSIGSGSLSRGSNSPLNSPTKYPRTASNDGDESDSKSSKRRLRGGGILRVPSRDSTRVSTAREGEVTSRSLTSRLPRIGVVCTPPLTVIHIREQHAEYINSSHHYLDIFPDERKRIDVVEGERPMTPPFLSTGVKPNPNRIHPTYSLGYRKLLELQVMMPTVFISVGQLFDLMNYFPSHGYLRVQLLQTVFAHVVDLDNFWQILDGYLTEDERMEALHRLGVLNVYDPIVPDRQYKLDLRRWEQRQMSKTLIALAVVEPGENWVNESFRWSKYDEPIPGWVLPGAWAMPDDDNNGEAGPRNHGWLIVEYTSTGPGCVPNNTVRKQLRRYMLVGLKKIL